MPAAMEQLRGIGSLVEDTPRLSAAVLRRRGVFNEEVLRDVPLEPGELGVSVRLLASRQEIEIRGQGVRQRFVSPERPRLTARSSCSSVRKAKCCAGISISPVSVPEPSSGRTALQLAT